MVLASTASNSASANSGSSLSCGMPARRCSSTAARLASSIANTWARTSARPKPSTTSGFSSMNERIAT